MISMMISFSLGNCSEGILIFVRICRISKGLQGKTAGYLLSYHSLCWIAFPGGVTTFLWLIPGSRSVYWRDCFLQRWLILFRFAHHVSARIFSEQAGFGVMPRDLESSIEEPYYWAIWLILCLAHHFVVVRNRFVLHVVIFAIKSSSGLIQKSPKRTAPGYWH